MKTLALRIMSPEKMLLQESAVSVVVPAVQGEMGFLPGHLPLLAQLNSGDVKIIRADNSSFSFTISSGFVQAMPGKVTILTDTDKSSLPAY